MYLKVSYLGITFKREVTFRIQWPVCGIDLHTW